MDLNKSMRTKARLAMTTDLGQAEREPAALENTVLELERLLGLL